MYFLKTGFVLFIASILLSSSAQSQQVPSTTPEEVFLLFRYQQGNVNEIVVAQYLNGTVYLPFRDLFRLLQIKYAVDSGMTRITGFYLTQERQYELDTKKLLARIDNKVLAIREGEISKTDLEIYAQPSLFEKIFGLRFTVDLRHLQLSLETDEVLPVVAEQDREQRKQMLNSLKQGQKDYPLLYGRSRSMFRAGVLDYSLTGMRENGATSSGYNFQGGAEVFDGELNASINGAHDQNGWGNGQHDLRWRYAFDERKEITQTSVGNLQGFGITQAPFTGVSVSNEPLVPRTMYQTMIIEEQTQPFWTVELYLNDQLTASARADETGRVRFEIPLTYGTNIFSLRKYGPSGEVVTERKRIQVPFTFLPSHELNYSIDAGRLQVGGFPLYQAQALYGLSNVLTNRVSLEYLRDTLRQIPVLTDVVSARVGESMLLAFEVSPTVRYRADMEVMYPSQISYDVTYTSFEPDRLYNPLAQRHAIQADGTIPFEANRVHYVLRSTVNRTDLVHGSNLYWTIGASVSHGPFMESLEERYSELDDGQGGISRKPVLYASALYNVRQFEGLPLNINSFLLGATATYDQSSRQISEVTCDISANILKQGRFRIGYQKDLLLKATTGFFELTFDFDFTRSSTSLYTGDRNAFSQSVSGALVYASDENILSVYGRQWNDNTGANFRMFLDENGNDKYDEGEKIIEGASVSIGQSASYQKSSGGLVKVWELLPYARYQAELLDVSMANNLWVPKHKLFAFITDPHRAKTMDIPYSAVGMIEGTVLRMRKEGKVPVPGLKVKVIEVGGALKKTISLFQDGSLYYVGLVPGKYTISVDSVQLNTLGLIARPMMREFIVKATAEGDAINGLDFILVESENKK
jgi:hypothetical protein